MNISLTNGSGNHPTEPDDCNLQQDLDEHQDILQMQADIEILGPPILVPEGNGYPGSYQVWSPVRYNDSYDLWAYVDSEGTIQYRSDTTLISIAELVGRAM